MTIWFWMLGSVEEILWGLMCVCLFFAACQSCRNCSSWRTKLASCRLLTRNVTELSNEPLRESCSWYLSDFTLKHWWTLNAGVTQQCEAFLVHFQCVYLYKRCRRWSTIMLKPFSLAKEMGHVFVWCDFPLQLARTHNVLWKKLHFFLCTNDPSAHPWQRPANILFSPLFLRMQMWSAAHVWVRVTLAWLRCSSAPSSSMRAHRPRSPSAWCQWCSGPNRYVTGKFSHCVCLHTDFT